MYDKYLIKQGDTLSTIAKKFNTNEKIILDLNNIPFPDMLRAGKEIIVPINKEKYFEYYTIKKGDTLWGLAKKNYGKGSKWPTIHNANKDKIKNPNVIVPGWKIKIPTKA